MRSAVGSPDGVTNPSMKPGDDEAQRQAHHDHHGAHALVAERLAAGAVTGRDERPRQPQPGGAGDGDRGELEQPVGEDQPPELRRPRRLGA